MRFNFAFLTALWLIIAFPLNVASQEHTSKKLSLDMVMRGGSLYPKSARGIRPMNDGELFVQTKKDSINVYSYKTGDFVKNIVTAGELIPKGDSTPIEMRAFGFSEDESKILFTTQTESIFRHSSIFPGISLSGILFSNAVYSRF